MCVYRSEEVLQLGMCMTCACMQNLQCGGVCVCVCVCMCVCVHMCRHVTSSKPTIAVIFIGQSVFFHDGPGSGGTLIFF